MTLTKMLTESLVFDYPDQIDDTKKVFQEWLQLVGLPDYYALDRGGTGFNTTESTRKLLITLVDEP